VDAVATALARPGRDNPYRSTMQSIVVTGTGRMMTADMQELSEQNEDGRFSV
jgi:hypothetical protein